jgi:hypothetical protein
MSLEKAFQEYLRMSRLTRRRVDRSDNNAAEERPYFDAIMVRINGSISGHRTGRHAYGHIPSRFRAGVAVRGFMNASFSAESSGEAIASLPIEVLDYEAEFCRNHPR